MRDSAVGIDIGKRRLAIGTVSGLSASLDIGKPGMPRHMELQMMQSWVQSQLPANSDLFIEQPFAGKGGIAAAQGLSETSGMLMSAGPWLSVTIVHPSTWKSRLLGNHVATKEQIAAWLAAYSPGLYSRTLEDEDQIDAMCIGIYGQMVLNGEIVVTSKPKPKRRRSRA